MKPTIFSNSCDICPSWNSTLSGIPVSLRQHSRTHATYKVHADARRNLSAFAWLFRETQTTTALKSLTASRFNTSWLRDRRAMPSVTVVKVHARESRVQTHREDLRFSQLGHQMRLHAIKPRQKSSGARHICANCKRCVFRVFEMQLFIAHRKSRRRERVTCISKAKAVRFWWILTPTVDYDETRR